MSQQVLSDRHVVIVGGGPGGMMAAAQLARLGAQVDVYEKYAATDAVYESTKGFRAGWLIMLGMQVAPAFESAGISRYMGEENRIEGSRTVHGTGVVEFLGPWKPEGQRGTLKRSDVIALASCMTIASHISNECRRVYSNRVTVHSGMELVDGNPAQGGLVFEDKGGARTEVRGDLIVGADGVYSTTRCLLQQHDPSMKVKLSDCASLIISLALTDPGDPTRWPKLIQADGQPFTHPFPDIATPPTGSYKFVYHPRPPGARDATVLNICAGRAAHDMTATLVISPRWLAKQRDRGEILHWLHKTFSHAPAEWLGEVADAVVRVIEGDKSELRQHKFLETNKLGVGRAVLVGDAGHSMSPHLGMGCNTALMDGPALAAAVTAVDGDVARVSAAFTAARLPTVAALVRMTKDQATRVTFDMHRNVLAVLGALPFTFGVFMGFLRRKKHMPGFLLPRTTLISLMSGSASPEQTERRLKRYSYTVLAGGTVVAAVAVAGVCRAVTAQR
eukprot:jgi/Ulvmu1/2255/UM013_0102.1